MLITPQRRLKVLLCCYACDPYAGSEPGGGWNFLNCVAQYHNVHVLVEEGKFKSRLLAYAESHPEKVKNITFHFIYRERARRLRKIWPPSYYVLYNRWLKKAYRYAKELDARENFDIVHQVNMAGYRVPGYLWKLNKPFIWGPICGFTTTPWRLLFGMGLHSFIYFGMRNIINCLQKRFGYAARIVSRKANAILVSDPRAVDEIKELWGVDSIVMREVGTSEPTCDITPTRHYPGTPLRICWVGRHIPCKAVDLILRAIPSCRESVVLEIIGDGAMEKKWKTLAQKLGINNQVNFHGRVPLPQVSELMRKCHVFCMPSIHEGGTPTVIMEAMQNGLPVVALNHCGYSTAIDDTCGLKIPISSRKIISEEMAKAFDFLATHEKVRYSMGINAIEHSKVFNWQKKAENLCKIYQEILGQDKASD